MKPLPARSGGKSSGRNVWSTEVGAPGFAWLCLAAFLWGIPAPAWTQQPAGSAPAPGSTPASQQAPAAPGERQRDPHSTASIRGTVVDSSGALVSGVRVGLSRDGSSPGQDATSGEDGQFYFASLAAGPFQLTIALNGFVTQTVSGLLQEGEERVVPQIALVVAPSLTEVSVTVSRAELNEVEFKEEEKQRVFGFIPNFYVSYVPHPAPLTPRQKFSLAWRTTIDPVSFAMLGVVAGVQQANNTFSAYGQGAQGYGKRYGAAYGDFFTDTFIGGAVFPVLLKQDPRYFYKGTGSKTSRFFYAVVNAVICKSDQGRWQPNYSGILGSIASGGISTLYYPPHQRGAALVFENALGEIGGSMVVNLFQEFLVRKLTPNLPRRESGKH